MEDDSKIIKLFFDRSEEALIELSMKYKSSCLTIAKNILGNEADAEESVNDAFLALWNKIPPERPEPLRAYLFKVVRNISVAKYHSNTSIKRNSHYDIALDELENCLSTSTVETEIDKKELLMQIDAFIDGLDKESRIMFMRRYWYSDSIQEIANSFKISNNNAAVRLSRIRSKLKKHLKKEGYEI